MDKVTHSQPASPGARSAEDKDPAISGGPTPMRFTVVALAFVVHFVAWIGYCALNFASADHYFGQGLPTGAAMFILACVAGAAAIVIARELSPIPRSIVTVLSIAIFGLSAIAELLARVAPPRPGLMALSFGEVATLIGMLVFPFVIAAVLVAVVGKAAVAGKAPAAGRPTTGAGITLQVCVVIAFCFHLPMFGVLDITVLPLWFQTEWPIALSSAVGTVAAVFLLAHGQVRASSPGWSLAIRFFGYVALVCGMFLCILATGQIVAFLPLGELTRVLWPGAALGFLVGTVALLVSVAAAKPRLSRDAPRRS